MSRKALCESVLSFVNAPGAIALIDGAAAQAVAANGQSLMVRKARGLLLNVWGNNNTTGGLRIRSGSMHNNFNNINLRILAGATRPLMGEVPNRLYSQDTIAVAQYGSAVGGEIEQNILDIAYPDGVEGLDARLLTAQEVLAFKASGQEEGKENIAVDIPVVGVATGQWGGAVALSTIANYGFKPNRYYAVRGISTPLRCCAMSFRSTESAGVRCAVPGEPNQTDLTANYFMKKSREFGIPAVQIFSAASLADAVVEVACNQAGGTFNLTLHCTLLNESFNPSNLI